MLSYSPNVLTAVLTLTPCCVCVADFPRQHPSFMKTKTSVTLGAEEISYGAERSSSEKNKKSNVNQTCEDVVVT